MRYLVPALAVAVHLLAAAALVTPLDAQGRDIGAVTEARRVGVLQLCPEFREAVAAAEGLRIRRDAEWRPTGVPAPVLVRDLLGVHQTLDARLRVQTAAHGTGVLYLAPSLLCHPRIPADTVIRGLRLRHSAWAEYEVFTDTVQVGDRAEERLGIAVERGALIVQWEPGPPLFILAVGDTATIRGTTAVVVVDSAGTEGLFLLEEGSATLSGFPGGIVPAGQLLHLRRGLPAMVLEGSALAAGVRASLAYHAGTVWRPPGPVARLQQFWSTGPAARATVVGAGSVAGFLVYRLLTDGYDPETHRGRIVVELPL